jgi:hypothetical protein
MCLLDLLLSSASTVLHGSSADQSSYTPHAVQSLLGAILMAPSLHSFDVWRIRTFNHFCEVRRALVAMCALAHSPSGVIHHHGPAGHRLVRLRRALSDTCVLPSPVWAQVNILGKDVTAWHPLTLGELSESGPLRRKLLRAFTTTPLKLLGSIADIGRSMQVC